MADRDGEASDNQLLLALQGGDEAGAEQIFARYYDRLICMVAKSYGSSGGNTETDSDVAQSVFRSFFRRGSIDEFHIADDGTLWPILVTIALNKIRNRTKYWTRQKRDVGKEVGQEELSAILSRDPTPDEAVILGEVIDDLMAQFPDRRQRILRMLLDGHALKEIMEAEGTTRFTIARTREAAAALLEKTLQGEADGPTDEANKGV